MAWRNGKGGVKHWVGEPMPEPDPVDLHLNYGMYANALTERERNRLEQLEATTA